MMINKLFFPLTKKSRSLKQAKNKLATLRNDYKTGNYSGHPEEMLWDIENAEIIVKKMILSHKAS